MGAGALRSTCQCAVQLRLLGYMTKNRTSTGARSPTSDSTWTGVNTPSSSAAPTSDGLSTGVDTPTSSAAPISDGGLSGINTPTSGAALASGGFSTGIHTPTSSAALPGDGSSTGVDTPTSSAALASGGLSTGSNTPTSSAFPGSDTSSPGVNTPTSSAGPSATDDNPNIGNPTHPKPKHPYSYITNPPTSGPHARGRSYIPTWANYEAPRDHDFLMPPARPWSPDVRRRSQLPTAAPLPPSRYDFTPTAADFGMGEADFAGSGMMPSGAAGQLGKQYGGAEEANRGEGVKRGLVGGEAGVGTAESSKGKQREVATKEDEEVRETTKRSGS
ncbi:hypothetical protein LTR53_013245 [Teratosphaeriaceae sp. CCFEE 6253]|nr:hypothetical protein LTR53_013245 [Teratosphaeriaceae sp. CCFEE 6253]